MNRFCSSAFFLFFSSKCRKKSNFWGRKSFFFGGQPRDSRNLNSTLSKLLNKLVSKLTLETSDYWTGTDLNNKLLKIWHPQHLIAQHSMRHQNQGSGKVGKSVNFFLLLVFFVFFFWKVELEGWWEMTRAAKLNQRKKNYQSREIKKIRINTRIKARRKLVFMDIGRIKLAKLLSKSSYFFFI